MKPSSRPSPLFRFAGAPSILTAALFCPAVPAHATPALPDPCKLITVAEMKQIVGPLKGAPGATDPKSGEISCRYAPSGGPRSVDIALHDGDLATWKKRNGGKTPIKLPKFGSDNFVNPDFNGWADLNARNGNLILRVTIPKGPQSIEAVRAIARKALARM